jgi:hypothetical protein
MFTQRVGFSGTPSDLVRMNRRCVVSSVLFDKWEGGGS